MRQGSLHGIMVVGKGTPAGEGGRKEDRRMQYLVRMDFVDPGPLLPIEQYAGMMRQAVLARR
jgi:hypothetical protein